MNKADICAHNFTSKFVQAEKKCIVSDAVGGIYS